MEALATLAIFFSLAVAVCAQQRAPEERVTELERKLAQATRRIEQLAGAVEALRAEVSRLNGGQPDEGEAKASQPVTAASSQSDSGDPAAVFVERIVEPELGGSERAETLRARPEVFVQARYSALPVRDAGAEFEPNLSLTRIETRWAGRVSERLGAGVEIQFHPALDGSPEELVNDAFIEYYLNNHTTVRVGQFVKPFGFDIQQSSAVRESPERAVFAGYFFPGQRDRGVLLSGDLRFLKVAALRDVQYFVGAFGGNRFFTDNNRRLNYLARVRKVWGRRFAAGLSAQAGKQLLPPGAGGDNNENIFGVDFQYAVMGRLGLRGEFAAGNTPATLLGIEPELAPAFRPGAHSTGGHLYAGYSLTDRDNLYARYDQLNGDPVTGQNVRAFNFGFFRQVGGQSRLGFDYQFKNRASFNDDAVNGRLNVTWGVEF